jgi:hypothetical protein
MYALDNTQGHILHAFNPAFGTPKADRSPPLSLKAHSTALRACPEEFEGVNSVEESIFNRFLRYAFGSGRDDVPEFCHCAERSDKAISTIHKPEIATVAICDTIMTTADASAFATIIKTFFPCKYCLFLCIIQS